jgi:hypothetical protein
MSDIWDDENEGQDAETVEEQQLLADDERELPDGGQLAPPD